MESSPHRTRLFIMMVLELAIWGAWFPLVFGYLKYLHFTNTQQSLVLNAFPVAAVIGMFFSNQFADRNFAAERFLAFSHLVGGLAILALFWAQSFPLFFTLMLVHCLLYVPTLSITNSVAFANLRDPQKEFGLVRMGGTVGWIAVSWPFPFLLSGPDSVKYTYLVAALVSLGLAAFSLTLPHTPAKGAKSEADKLAWLEAGRLLRSPVIFVLWIVAFIDAVVHNSYFFWSQSFLTSPQVGIQLKWVMPIMSIGQIMEIVTMFILGGVLKKLGWKITMCVGVFGYAIRFAVFAFLPQYTWLIIGVNVLHGLCYAFFFATVYIFVDAYLPKDARASAQGLFNVMILGFGALAAFFACPWVESVFTSPESGVDYRHLFLVPCGASVFATLLLAFGFYPPKNTEAPVVVH